MRWLDRRGFTIVELLIVIVIIGILAALVVVAYNGIQQRALTTSLQNDLKNAARVLEKAKIDNGDVYPASFPSDFKTGGTVSLNLANTGSTDTYCINGSIQGVTQIWRYEKSSGGLVSGACTGQIIAGSDVGGSGTKVNYIASPDFTTGWALNKATGSSSASTRAGTGSDPAGNRTVLVLQNNASTTAWSYIGGTMNATGMSASKTYTTSVWARILSGTSIGASGAGVMTGSASNRVLEFGGNTSITTSWQKITNSKVAAIAGQSNSLFYLYVSTTGMNQNITIELQDPRVEEQ